MSSKSEIIKSQPEIMKSPQKKQSCHRHGLPAARAWKPEAKVAKRPLGTSSHRDQLSEVMVSLHSVRTQFSSWWLGY